MVTVNVQCSDCFRIRKIELPYEYAEFKLKELKWKAGIPIQKVFSELTPSQREALITGICDNCWELLTSEDEERESPF